MSNSAPLSATVPDLPCKRELRARLFWCARWLLGGSDFHRGAIVVSVGEGDPDGGDTLVIRPRPGDEMYDADTGPDRGERLAALAPKLLAALVSADGRKVLKVIADRGPVAAKVIAHAAGVERSKCYVLLTDLRDRGLIVDQGDGYEIADAELWGALAGPRAMRTDEAS